MTKPNSPISERTDRIRQLNDQLRTLRGSGEIHIVGALAEMDEETQKKVLTAIMTFAGFNDGDDPYGEHDFGAVTVAGERFMFKIDYYAPDLESGSDDPADPAKTVRVMSVFHASDY